MLSATIDKREDFEISTPSFTSTLLFAMLDDVDAYAASTVEAKDDSTKVIMLGSLTIFLAVIDI